jgi:hypothetical protein
MKYPGTMSGLSPLPNRVFITIEGAKVNREEVVDEIVY